MHSAAHFPGERGGGGVEHCARDREEDAPWGKRDDGGGEEREEGGFGYKDDACEGEKETEQVERRGWIGEEERTEKHGERGIGEEYGDGIANREKLESGELTYHG